MKTKETTATKVVTESANEVMNPEIVRLNEMKGVKLANISKSKRPAAKFNKEVATYLLDNWDSLEKLEACKESVHKDMPMIGCDEVIGIYETRTAQLLVEIKAKEDVKAKTQKAKSGKETKSGGKGKHAVTRKVGDHHPTKPWVWTEYAEGKFDWRIDPAVKKMLGRKSEGDTKPTAKKAESKQKTTKKASLTELLSKPMPKGMSKAQADVVRMLKKGFRLQQNDNGFWLVAGENKTSVQKAVLEAIQRKYKITYIPDGLYVK